MAQLITVACDLLECDLGDVKTITIILALPDGNSRFLPRQSWSWYDILIHSLPGFQPLAMHFCKKFTIYKNFIAPAIDIVLGVY